MPAVFAVQLLAAPLTFQVTEPVGAGLGPTPTTFAVKVIGMPTVVVVGEADKRTCGWAAAKLIGKVVEVAVR
jgi:hypothetical protein